MKKLTLDGVAGELANCNALVIDMLGAAGFPQLMVMVPAHMPVFVWLHPDRAEVNPVEKLACQDNVKKFGAHAYELRTESDLIDLVHQIRAITKPEANTEGFDFDPTEPLHTDEAKQATTAETAEDLANEAPAKTPDMSFLD